MASVPTRKPDAQPLPPAIMRQVCTGVPNRNSLSHNEAHRGEQRILVSVAASAQAHGWDFPQYRVLILDDESSHIGDQIRMPRDRKKRAHETNVLRRVRRAWDTALEVRSRGTGWDRDLAAQSVASLARAAAEDPTAMLTPDMRAALRVFADLSEKHRHSRVAMTRRDLIQQGDLTEYRARSALDRLLAREWLECVERGVGGDPKNRVAAKYVPGWTLRQRDQSW